MFQVFLLFVSLIISASAYQPSEDAIVNQDLITALLEAPTIVDRIAILDNDTDFVYNFQTPASSNAITKGLGGMTVKADRKLFPALIGTGVSMTVGFLEPCGFNTPHSHPRSSEINVVVQGRLGSEFIAENGARPVFNTLDTFEMTVFPRGAVHTEFNPDCESAVFVAGFADEDPGVQQTAQTLLALKTDLLNAVFGSENATIDGMDIDTFRPLLPQNVAQGVESCLRKCGIKKNAKRRAVQM